MKLFLKQVNQNGTTKMVPTLLSIVIIIALVMICCAYVAMGNFSSSSSPLSKLENTTEKPVSENIENGKGAKAYLNDQAQAAQDNATLPAGQQSMKRGILTSADVNKAKTTSEQSKKDQFYMSENGNLGEKKELTDQELGQLPLWTRVIKAGLRGAAINAGDRVAENDLGKIGSQNNNMPAKPTAPTVDPAELVIQRTLFGSGGGSVQTVAYDRRRDHRDSVIQEDHTIPTPKAFSQNFLPAGQLIPVIFITGMDTRGKNGNFILAQLARPNVAQHHVQLAAVRFLCKFEEELLGTDETESRLSISADRILFPNGTERSLSGAHFYDARDKSFGVVATHIVPPLWKQLLPTFIADMSSGLLQGSQTQVTNLSNGSNTTVGSTTNALKQGGADAIQGAGQIYIQQLQKENQPYSVLPPGRVAFIMTEAPIDLSGAEVNDVAIENVTQKQIQEKIAQTANSNLPNNNTGSLLNALLHPPPGTTTTAASPSPNSTPASTAALPTPSTPVTP